MQSNIDNASMAGWLRGNFKYGNWTIEYNPKPTPDRGLDFDYVHDDHDGEQWSCGCAKSAQACIAEINEKELDIAEGIYL